MQRNRKSRVTEAPPAMPAGRPSVVRLLTRIAEAAFSGDMRWIVACGGAVIFYLHANHMQTDLLLALLVCGVAAVSLLRGMRAWQADIEEYRRSLTEYRMLLTEQRNRARIRKNIAWDRH